MKETVVDLPIVAHHKRQAYSITRKQPDGFFDALRVQGFKPSNEKILHTIFTQHAIESGIKKGGQNDHASKMLAEYAAYHAENISKR